MFHTDGSLPISAKGEEHSDRMYALLQESGVEAAGRFAHTLSEPFRLQCLNRLLAAIEMDYPIGCTRWVEDIISGRIG